MRAVNLAESQTRIDQNELGAGIHGKRILLDQKIALVEEIGGDGFIDPVVASDGTEGSAENSRFQQLR
jgi:hypothetical protein